MNSDLIRGIIVPVLTPIDGEERIHEEKLREQVDFVINGGIHGILAFGSNGEFYMVEEDELRRGLRIIIDQVCRRVPVYMGIGAINTRKCQRIACMARELGADAISVLQPMFIKPTEEELLDHFITIASAIPDMPVLLYNNPGRTGYTMSANLVEKLAGRSENICGIKDSSGDLTQTMEFIHRMRGRNFKVLAGKDTLIFASLTHGAVGAVATTANFVPGQVVNIYNQCIAGNYKEALEVQFKLAHVRMAMDRASFPVATKDLANMTGRDVGSPYLPNKASSGETITLLRKAMEEANFV